MSEAKGLSAIPARLTPDQARIIDAHAQLQRSLGAIEYPKSGRWEKLETAVAVLEALADYVSATCDEETAGDIIEASSHTELLDDMITHFRQASSGTMDRRLSPNVEGAAGAAHDDTLIAFKLELLKTVDHVAKQERKNRKKDPVAEARRRVTKICNELGITVRLTRKGKPKAITPSLLESWEKRPLEGRRQRAK